MYVNRCCNYRRQKCGKGTERILKYKDITIEIKHRTIHNNKPDIIIRDNGKGTFIGHEIRMYKPTNRCCNLRRQK